MLLSIEELDNFFHIRVLDFINLFILFLLIIYYSDRCVVAGGFIFIVNLRLGRL